MDEDDRNERIIALYNRAMEEARHRRTIEWQTFVAVNAVYGFALKILYDYSGRLTVFEAVIVTIAALLFTYIWSIRIYGNARRYDFSRAMRDNIQCQFSHDDVIRNLIPSGSTAGGLRCWNNGWPFWSGHVCIAIWLYLLVFMFSLWKYKTRYGTECTIQRLIKSAIGLLRESDSFEPSWWHWMIMVGVMIGLFALFDWCMGKHRRGQT